MADDHDGVAASGDRGAHVVGGRPGRELVERVRLAEAEGGSSLARAEKRARQHCVRREAFAAKLLAEAARLLLPGGRERAELVGISRRGFGVTNEDEPHTGAEGYPPAAVVRVSPGSTCAAVYSLSVASLRYVVADVFTDTALTGNQLAVFTDGRDVDDETMQKLAKEMNYSESVFVLPPESGGHARIRIFTPVTELPFAGHPVLGSAFVLAGPLQLGEIKLETLAGVIPIVLEREGARITFGWMSQPIPEHGPFAEADAVQELLGIRSQLPVELYQQGPGFAYFEVESKEALAALSPDFAALGRITDFGISCFAGSGASWKTRMFAPTSGVPEDPATGSAAGPLAMHLARNGRIAFGDEIEIAQGEEVGRPSKLFARVTGTPERTETIEVGGSAVIVARGEFKL
jgi:trans-2,3-dihydro-3-hydroxyanthranilate isomerase